MSQEQLEEMKGQKNTIRLNQPSTDHEYFHGHKCFLEPETLSAFYVKITNPFSRFLFHLTTVRIRDCRALSMYRSYATLCAERYRHYKFYPYAIHPFSKLRLYLEITCVLVNVILGSFLAAHYTKVDAGLQPYYNAVIGFCDITFVINIIGNFLTGYVVGQSRKSVVLDADKVALHYAKTWLIVDLISLVSVIPLVYDISDPGTKAIIESTKFLRILTSLKYLNNILIGIGATMCQKTATEILFYIVMYLTWNIYIQFCVQYWIEGTYDPVSPKFWSWLTYGNLWNKTWPIRFLYAMNRGGIVGYFVLSVYFCRLTANLGIFAYKDRVVLVHVGMLTTNTNMNLMEDDRYKHGCFEVIFVGAWLLSKFLVVHFALKYVMILFGTESARAKYYIMQKQVEHYMKQRKFPPRLMKKILNFYAIRFQAKYFTESQMLNAMTGQLRDDILMHRVQQVVKELAFLKLLPGSLLMQVILKLKVVIYIAGDIIFKINTIGDCLYFIDKGTVATYSESGQEISHFEDGDFFGATALFMPHRFQTTSAVAVTNCELYRLNKEDIDDTIAHCPTAWETIKKVALSRFENACVLDEHHKADLKAAEGMEYNYIK